MRSPLVRELGMHRTQFYVAFHADDMYRFQDGARVQLSRQRQGDMREARRRSPEQDPRRGIVRRNGVRKWNRKWPEARIPYTLSNHYSTRAAVTALL